MAKPARRVLAALGLLAAALLVTAPLMAAVGNVSLENVSFVPESIEIRAGDSVVWTHNDQFEHTVTSASDEESFDFPEGCGVLGGCMQNGEIFTYQFTSVGNFPYFCRVHCPRGASDSCRMRGEIVVLAAATPTPTPTPTAVAAPVSTPEPTAEPTPTPSPTPTPLPLPTFAPVPLSSPLALEGTVNEQRDTLLAVAAGAAALATLAGLFASWRFSAGYRR